MERTLPHLDSPSASQLSAPELRLVPSRLGKPSGGAEVVPDLELSVEARPENVRLVRDVLVSACEGLCLSPAFISRLTLAASEACTNVVIHAYEGSATGPMHITAFVESDGLRIAVRDEGLGIRPRFDSPGLGLGFPLIAAVADQVEFRSDDSGNEVRMSFGTTT